MSLLFFASRRRRDRGTHPDPATGEPTSPRRIESTVDTGRAAAVELFAALVVEAQSWACDDEQALADSLDEMPPTQVLDILADTSLIPSHLYDAMVGALIELDPHTYAR